MKFIERLVLRAADRVIVIHPKFAEYLSESLRIDSERIVVIRNWTHLKPSPSIARDDARAALSWPTDVRLAVHTGNMGVKQGLENIVAAARLADEHDAPIKFILVGDGCERPRLEQLASGIRSLEFVDPLPEGDYRCALSAADCLLVNELPGVSSMAVPSKLTSYFDAMRPIVAATDRQGITAGEIQQAKAGVVVPAGDPEVLLETILKLCADSERATGYGVAGCRYRANVLDEEVAINAFATVVRQLAAERESRQVFWSRLWSGLRTY